MHPDANGFLLRKRIPARLNSMAKKKKRSNFSPLVMSPPPDPVFSSLSRDITSTVYSDFATRLDRNGILDLAQSKSPANLGELRARLTDTHAAPISHEPTYEDYIDMVGGVVNRETLVAEMLPLFTRHPQKHRRRVLNEPFKGFPINAGFNYDLPEPQPHYVEALRVQDYRLFPLEEHIKGAVPVPRKDTPDHSLALPHLAGEWASPGESMGETRLRSAYHGAALVYARNQALAYIDSPDRHGHAEIVTFVTDGTMLVFFAHYARAPPDSYDITLEYHQYPVAMASLTGSRAEFESGRALIEHFQKAAYGRSCELRDRLLEHWGSTCPGLRRERSPPLVTVASVDGGCDAKDEHEDGPNDVDDGDNEDDGNTFGDEPEAVEAEVGFEEDDDFVFVD
ncbi:hypothetical protein F4775DRAFT_279929 [Biscogniauxia sp. FL1348]|nr:hypothetical protein F4775DRAFT_279929 [Biscogniauxia sp. FL1348]